MRTRAARAAETTHHHRGLQTMTCDIANHQPQLARRKYEEVVPIAADCAILGGDEPNSKGEPRALRECRRQQAAFEQQGRCPFDRQRPRMDRCRDPFTDDLEKPQVVVVERSIGGPSDMEHAEDSVLAQQRNAEHHLDALLPQNRVRNRRRVDAVQPRWLSRSGDTTSETNADRDSHTLADFLLDARRRSGDKLVGVGIEQQDDGGVDVEHLADSHQHLFEKIVDAQARETRVGQGLQLRKTAREVVLAGIQHPVCPTGAHRLFGNSSEHTTPPLRAPHPPGPVPRTIRRRRA